MRNEKGCDDGKHPAVVQRGKVNMSAFLGFKLLASGIIQNGNDCRGLWEWEDGLSEGSKDRLGAGRRGFPKSQKMMRCKNRSFLDF